MPLLGRVHVSAIGVWSTPEASYPTPLVAIPLPGRVHVSAVGVWSTPKASYPISLGAMPPPGRFQLSSRPVLATFDEPPEILQGIPELLEVLLRFLI
jgi:hypothetical protein